MTYVLEVERLESTEIIGVSVEHFVNVVEKLNKFMGMDEDIHFEEIEEGLGTTITYRDSANYKYPFSLLLNGRGEVLIVEPDWFGDEEEEQELFGSILREYFAPTV